MPSAIDYDRGVQKRIKEDEAGRTILEIFMYEDQPGVYLTVHGTEVPAELAREAGFPVDRQLKEKIRRERLAAASAAIEAELFEANETESRTVVAQAGDMQIAEVGPGLYLIEDTDGKRYTPTPIPREVADRVFAQLTGGMAEPEPEPRPAGPDPDKIRLRGKKLKVSDDE